jgi:hypothetical protein
MESTMDKDKDSTLIKYKTEEMYKKYAVMGDDMIVIHSAPCQAVPVPDNHGCQA